MLLDETFDNITIRNKWGISMPDIVELKTIGAKLSWIWDSFNYWPLKRDLGEGFDYRAHLIEEAQQYLPENLKGKLSYNGHRGMHLEDKEESASFYGYSFGVTEVEGEVEYWTNHEGCEELLECLGR